ncbi:MAG: molybdopterin oxidoreductase family protein, partial [Candidatus Hodarchaeota archaeon]
MNRSLYNGFIVGDDDMESSCIYCGLGCRLNYEIDDNKILKITGVKSDDVSDGVPCIKGLTINEVYDKNRIRKPLIKKNDRQVQVTLSEAYNFIYENTKNLSPNDVFFNTSGKLTNENNYVMQKLARVCYKTANIDSCCGRICHIATVMGMLNVFGTSNLTRISNLDKIDTLLIIGSEPNKNYPTFFNKMMRKRDLKIIKIHSFEKSDNKREYLINILPGSQTSLLNGVINELIKKGVKSKVQGFKILEQKVKAYTPEFVCGTCKISRKNYIQLVNMVYESKSLGVFHGMALTQHVNSLENVHTLLNLVLLKKGKVLSLRGEVNV